MACPGELWVREQGLQRLLETAARSQRARNTLALEDMQGATLALLEAVYF